VRRRVGGRARLRRRERGIVFAQQFHEPAPRRRQAALAQPADAEAHDHAQVDAGQHLQLPGRDLGLHHAPRHKRQRVRCAQHVLEHRVAVALHRERRRHQRRPHPLTGVQRRGQRALHVLRQAGSGQRTAEAAVLGHREHVAHVARLDRHARRLWSLPLRCIGQARWLAG
jgi:hypothetical protein